MPLAVAGGELRRRFRQRAGLPLVTLTRLCIAVGVVAYICGQRPGYIDAFDPWSRQRSAAPAVNATQTAGDIAFL